ncbi:peroxiredoxin-like family protein [Dokdonella sp.]|uniref:peroxiredoxin-like family protein n=1 Tax=Dokdonella sp. TaxID=2291710 RepID=UPI003C6161B9
MIRMILASCMLFSASAMAAGTLADSADAVCPILLGSAMPDVAMQTIDGKPTTLKQQVDGQPAILVFYRGGWCPYCNMQLSDLRLIAAETEALGYRLIAISPDLPGELGKTMTKDKLDYTLLSDSKADAMRAFGIGFRVDDATIEKYKGYGIDLEKASGENHHALPVPSVFIVDAAGVLQFSYVHPDYKVRVPGTVIMAAAKAIADRKHQVKPAR